MDLKFARQILKAAESDPAGCLRLHGRKMRHEAELMQEAGWLELTKVNGVRSAIVARVTATGHRISRLFREDAVAQRLRDAFMPGNAPEAA